MRKLFLLFAFVFLNFKINCQPTIQFQTHTHNMLNIINQEFKNDLLIKAIYDRNINLFNECIKKTNTSKNAIIQVDTKLKVSTNCIYLIYALMNSTLDENQSNRDISLKIIQQLIAQKQQSENIINFILKIKDADSTSPLSPAHFAVFYEVQPEILEAVLIKNKHLLKNHNHTCKCNKIVLDLKSNYSSLIIKLGKKYQEYIGLGRFNYLMSLNCFNIPLYNFAKILNSFQYLNLLYKHQQS